MTVIAPEDTKTLQAVLYSLAGKKSWVIASIDEQLKPTEEKEMVANLDYLHFLHLKSYAVVWIDFGAR